MDEYEDEVAMAAARFGASDPTTCTPETFVVVAPVLTVFNVLAVFNVLSVYGGGGCCCCCCGCGCWENACAGGRYGLANAGPAAPGG